MRIWILKTAAIFLGIFAGLVLANAQAPKPSGAVTGRMPDGVKPAAVTKVYASTPPVISDKLRGDFFKAQAEAQQAQTALEQARQTSQAMLDVFQSKLKEAQAACGPDHQLSQDSKRDLVCVDKPKFPEPAKK